MGLRNIIGAIAILAFALWYGDLATQLPKRVTTDAPGPHFIPYLITISILFLAGLLLVQGIIGLRATSGLADLVPQSPVSNKSYSFGRAAAGMLVIALYLSTLGWFGFFWSTPFFFAGLMWVSGERRPGVLLVLAIAVPLFLFFLFRDLFQLPLPKGNFL